MDGAAQSEAEDVEQEEADVQRGKVEREFRCYTVVQYLTEASRNAPVGDDFETEDIDLGADRDLAADVDDGVYDEDDEDGLESDEDEDKFGGIDMEEDTDGELRFRNNTESKERLSLMHCFCRAHAYFTAVFAAAD